MAFYDVPFTMCISGCNIRVISAKLDLVTMPDKLDVRIIPIIVSINMKTYYTKYLPLFPSFL